PSSRRSRPARGAVSACPSPTGSSPSSGACSGPRTATTAGRRSSSSCRSGSPPPDGPPDRRAPPGPADGRLRRDRRAGGGRSRPSPREWVRQREPVVRARERLDALHVLHLAHVVRHVLAAKRHLQVDRQRPPGHPRQSRRRDRDLGGPRDLADPARRRQHPDRSPLVQAREPGVVRRSDRKSTRLNSSHVAISYAVFCLKKKTTTITNTST